MDIQNSEISEETKESSATNVCNVASTDLKTENVFYKDGKAIFVDPDTHIHYEWNTSKNEWQQRGAYTYEDDCHVYIGPDGIKQFWDNERRAWFPKLDTDFLAQYQLNYGFNTEENTKCNDPSKVEQTVTPPSNASNEKRKPSEPSWFKMDIARNNKVYVSNLPLDTTEAEFIELMQKCGLVMKDINSGEFKIKLYKEPGTDYLKGDALCTYIKVESVDLALKILDESDFKGRRIRVERAQFEMKGDYNPKLKPKMQKKKEKQKLKRSVEKMFDWRPEKKQNTDARPKHEKIVIVKNLFEPKMFDSDVGLILEIQEDLREECQKLGQVRRITIFDHHSDGVAQINMSSPEEADSVVSLLNGRWYMKRQLKAELWDGEKKYNIAETDSQVSERLAKWDEYLESND